MPEKEPGKTPRLSKSVSTTPEDFPVTSPGGYPSGDYSYTVELVGTIQHQLGKLTEAVETLKAISTEHGRKLADISGDIHTAKTTLKIVGGILAAVLAFAGWVGNKAVDAYVESHRPPTAQVK
jgi:hypothetical protein